MQRHDQRLELASIRELNLVDEQDHAGALLAGRGTDLEDEVGEVRPQIARVPRARRRINYRAGG